MAIHVRRKGKLLAERRKRMIISSLLSALTVLVLGGIIMYFVVIFFAKEEPAEFITYTPPPNNSDVPKPPTEEEMSSRAAAPSPDINPAVIVSTGVSAVVMAQVDVEVPDFGVGNGLGEGDGMGFDGSGFGHGTGKGNGKGDGGGKGLNDDVQVVLCLDASGSMDQLFVEVADSLNMLVNTMTRCRLNGKKARVNLGIVVYGQAMDNGAPRVLTPFTTDVKSMRSKLKEIQCDGAVEPCGEVISFALDNFEWNMRDREDILKIIFIAGNEDFKQGTLDYRTAMHKAKRKNVIVNTIYCYPGMEEEALMTPEGKEWADAATYADGMGLVITMDGSTPAGSPDDAKLHAAAKALWDVPVMAMGGPDAQARCMKEYAGRPPMPKKQGEINDWLAENSELLMRSYDWDLVELCRRYEDEFSLEVIGGPGNLPKELRGISNSEAVSRLQDAAETRSKALRTYMNAAGAGSGFCGKALRALRIQAQEKGIELKS